MIGPLRFLGETARATNEANGFDPPTQADWADRHKVPAFLGLIHSEVSEALEAFRENDLSNFEEEMADIVIRTLDLAYGLGLDIDKAVAEKMTANAGRPYRHGDKRL